jgi:hypothetical protein
VIRIRSVSYDPAARAVTIRPARLLNLNRVFQLVVNGTSTVGLTDLAGNALDGDADGRPGGDFTGRIDRASLAEVPSDTARLALVSSRHRLKSG